MSKQKTELLRLHIRDEPPSVRCRAVGARLQPQAGSRDPYDGTATSGGTLWILMDSWRRFLAVGRAAASAVVLQVQYTYRWLRQPHYDD